MARDPWEDAIELALAVIAAAVIAYALLSRPGTVEHKHKLASFSLEGCYEVATAPPFSGDLRDWICAV